MTRTYATPGAFKQALEARLSAEATRIRMSITRLRQMLVFERFLVRVHAVCADNVIVKGGMVVELRLGRARTTRDIDLWWTGSAAGVLDVLRSAAIIEAGDHLVFEVERDKASPDLAAAGMKYDGQRFRARSVLAGRPYGDPFGVDVAFAEPLAEPPEEISGRDLLAFAGITTPRFRVYPRSTHIAEKLHALTLPRATSNSRVKDLPDIALLASAGPMEMRRLRNAIEGTFQHRATHSIPERLPAPSPQWAAVYERMALVDALQWRTLGDLEVAVRAFLDPVLAAGTGDAAWSPTTWTWT